MKRFATRLISRRPLCRYKHTHVPLPYDVNKGLGEFLPPAALKVVSFDYQKGLLDRLNEEVRGTDLEGQPVVQTIVSSAPDRSRVLAFNYASLALNNHFFLDGLAPPPDSLPNHEHHISSSFIHQIRAQHGSLAQLKSNFSAAAMGLFTNGFIWFVTDSAGNTAVVPTLGPGSLLVRSQTYMASTKGMDVGFDMGQWGRGDLLTEEDPYFEEWKEETISLMEKESARAPTTNAVPSHSLPGTSPASPASGVSAQNPTQPSHTRSLHSSPSTFNDLKSRFTRLPSSLDEDDPARTYEEPLVSPNPKNVTRTEVLAKHGFGQTLYPLFALSVHEHAWMSAGFGVWGKEAWIKKFWSVVDWKKATEAYEHVTKPKN
ncbi:Manganese/iron superoxide dismutase [Rhodocollybia butyracea]|uniref:Manganese/iron superoxide dismutase n=1 Tax=Rhodocollybia butyracea TaxID=206335 RepID=A0A9P5PZE6_9AGAR|nr:Manganese/iron superoxide dismutase [Rhodocollybia butyracea]